MRPTFSTKLSSFVYSIKPGFSQLHGEQLGKTPTQEPETMSFSEYDVVSTRRSALGSKEVHQDDSIPSSDEKIIKNFSSRNKSSRSPRPSSLVYQDENQIPYHQNVPEILESQDSNALSSFMDYPSHRSKQGSEENDLSRNSIPIASSKLRHADRYNPESYKVKPDRNSSKERKSARQTHQDPNHLTGHQVFDESLRVPAGSSSINNISVISSMPGTFTLPHYLEPESPFQSRLSQKGDVSGQDSAYSPSFGLPAPKNPLKQTKSHARVQLIQTSPEADKTRPLRDNHNKLRGKTPLDSGRRTPKGQLVPASMAGSLDADSEYSSSEQRLPLKTFDSPGPSQPYLKGSPHNQNTLREANKLEQEKQRLLDLKKRVQTILGKGKQNLTAEDKVFLKSALTELRGE